MPHNIYTITHAIADLGDLNAWTLKQKNHKDMKVKIDHIHGMLIRLNHMAEHVLCAENEIVRARQQARAAIDGK